MIQTMMMLYLLTLNANFTLERAEVTLLPSH